MGLQQIELVLEVEDEFNISIDADDEFGQSAMTFGDFYDLVLRLVRADPNSALRQRPDLESLVWKRLSERAAQHGFGVRAQDITRETRFINDLGYG